MSASTLLDAVRRGVEAEIRRLVESGADINRARDDGWTPLFTACARGHRECARLLMLSCADVSKAVIRGWTELHLLCVSGDARRVQQLVDAGADTNRANTYGKTPLYLACRNGHETCARVLVEGGADVHQASNFGMTPLRIACDEGHEACARVLAEGGADVDQTHRRVETPLSTACRNGHGACVRLLLEHGADPNALDRQGQTAYDRAHANKHTACEVVLGRFGARLDSVDLQATETSVEVAVAVGGNQFIKEVRIASVPSEELRAIMWRSPSLQKIVFNDGSVSTRGDDRLALRPALQRGDRVRVVDTEGEWEVASVVGDNVELHGREGTVPVDELVFAGPCHLAWQEVNAAESRGQSNVITQLLSGQGVISTRVRSLVADFMGADARRG